MVPLGVYTLVWLLSIFTAFCNLLATSNETENDQQALLCFKSQISSPAPVFVSWNNASLEFCNWHGVSCSALSPRRVIELNLPSEGIKGLISPCIANLTSLAKLQLSNNSFHGSIPSEFRLLHQLSYLNLSMNYLEGNIPAELSSCSQLRILGLWNNSLQGQIPPALSQCRHLQEINLSNNKLQGSIPYAFGNLHELQILDLSRNNLRGNIPPELGSSLSLTYVNLGSNALTGGIPESIANSSSLQILKLMKNNLTGQVPKALFNTSSIVVISLQQNQLVGSIPPVTAIFPPVQHLDLGENYLSGSIPSSIGNLSSLVFVYLNRNKLVGSIPECLGSISTLEILNLNENYLSGPVPKSLFNMSALRYIAVAENYLTGRLPSNIGFMPPSIQGLILTGNKFEGPIPTSLLNASNLKVLELGNNSLSGFIPFFGSLPNLEVLDLGNNMLDAGDWTFISSLSNCSKLTTMLLDGNNLQGKLPGSFGNLSESIEMLWLRNNSISGHIPPEIGNLRNLNELLMDYNLFIGDIPQRIGNLRELGVLYLAHNKLSGQIPHAIGNLIQLTELKLNVNNFSGRIPETIGHCTQLQIFNLAHNSLDGSIASKIFKITTTELDLSHNYLSGEIPEEVGNLINLKKLCISNNLLSGNIPSNIGRCVVLEYLEIQSNYFAGSIPQSLANLVAIKDMDISQNNLSGDIPEFLVSMSSLQHLNLSFNNFDGAIPRGGIFDKAGAVSVEGNGHLCTSVPTGAMTLCSEFTDRGRKHKIFALVLGIVISVVAALIMIFSCLTAIRWRKRMQVKSNLPKLNTHIKNITYRDIVNATERFSSSYLIGSGSFGVVYKGNLHHLEDQVDIKIFKLDIYGADRSFFAEYEALRNLRHRNLVKIITLCSSVDYTGSFFKALVFQYMPNGNLDSWLHPMAHDCSQRDILTLSQRINISMDVASALDYLHTQCATPLIHCDLKPSDVLLDLNLTAYVSDFGQARFLYTRNAYLDCSESLPCIKGSIGYIPPEYGTNEAISTKGDVYSSGVLLLEMVTGSRPTDEKFSDGTNLHSYVERAFPEKIHEIVDPRMLRDEIDAAEVTRNCIIPLVRIGLSCSMTSPKERPEMGRVYTAILAVKEKLSYTNGK